MRKNIDIFPFLKEEKKNRGRRKWFRSQSVEKGKEFIDLSCPLFLRQYAFLRRSLSLETFIIRIPMAFSKRDFVQAADKSCLILFGF